MTLTLLALAIIPFGLWEVLRPDEAHKTLKHLTDRPENRFTVAIVLIGFSLLILSDTGLSVAWDWNHLLAILGILVSVKGIIWLFFPQFVHNLLVSVHAKNVPVFGFIRLLIALALIYVDTQLI